MELELHRLDCLGSHGDLSIYEQLKREAESMERQPELQPPLVTGTDLLALGMQPGPELGALLARIRDKQLQEELRTRDEALAWAAAQLRQSGQAAP